MEGCHFKHGLATTGMGCFGSVCNLRLENNMRLEKNGRVSVGGLETKINLYLRTPCISLHLGAEVAGPSCLERLAVYALMIQTIASIFIDKRGLPAM